MNTLETAFQNRNTVKPAPIVPKDPAVLKEDAKKLQIPIVDTINLGADFVGKMLVKFNLGRDPRNIPTGVKELVHTMDSTARMAANLQKAAEVAGDEVTDKNRMPGRTHDTALGILGAKRVDCVRITGMTELEKAGLMLRDVNSQRTNSGNYTLVFVYTRVPFADGKHFAHCPEIRARGLEMIFSGEVSREVTTFWNPDKSITVNAGPYWDGPAEKDIVVCSLHNNASGTLVLMLADTPQ